MTDEPWNWDGVSDATVREMMRLAELQLADLLTASIAADQRAAAQAGILAGFGAALIAIAATAGTGDAPQLAAAWGAFCAGVGMIWAAFMSGVASRPTDYFVSGYEPRRLLGAAVDEAWLLRCVVEDMQMRITKNRAVLDQTASLTDAAYKGALAAIALGVGVFVAFHLSS